MVLFRTEAGPRIGLGHLRRSISLAQALRRQGIRSRFFVSGSDENVAYVQRFGFSAEPIPLKKAWGSEELTHILERSSRLRAKAVVVDSPRVPLRYLAGLKEAGRLVLLRDDRGNGAPFPVHGLLNGNADARRLRYHPNGFGTRFLLGPQYAVLPREFWRRTARTVRESVRSVLVILGGEDPRGLMPGLIRLLDRIAGEFSITAVVGPFFRNRESVKALAKKASHPVRILESPASLYSLMRETDLAVSGAGQTLYELACVGCPTVAIQVADDQLGQAKALARVGCIRLVAGARPPDLFAHVEKEVVSLMKDLSLRAAMARAGPALVDGQGAYRVASRLRRWES